MSDPLCWPWATPSHNFDMVAEPRMSVLSSSPLRCNHSVTTRGMRRRRTRNGFLRGLRPCQPGCRCLGRGIAYRAPNSLRSFGGGGRSLRLGPLSSSHDTFLFSSLRDLSPLAPEAECKLVPGPCAMARVSIPRAVT